MFVWLGEISLLQSQKLEHTRLDVGIQRIIRELKLYTFNTMSSVGVLSTYEWISTCVVLLL